VHQDKSAEGFNHLPHRFARRLIRSNGGAHRDAAILGDFGGDIADAPYVDVAMFLGESELARQVLSHQIAIEQRDRPSAHFEELGDQRIGDGRFARTGSPVKKMVTPCLCRGG